MKRARRAFTLIELLVVVAIIALLIALLLPAIGRAKIISQRTACGTNVKAICLALQVYFNESSNINPLWAMYDVYPKGQETIWPIALAPYLGIQGVDAAPMQTTASGRYATFAQAVLGNKGKRTPLYCPIYTGSLPDASTWTYSSGFSYTTYAANGAVWSPSLNYLFLDSPEIFAATATTDDPYALREKKPGFAFSRRIYQKPPYTPLFVHNGGSSVTVSNGINHPYGWNMAMLSVYGHGQSPPIGFADGHVEFIPGGEILGDYRAAGGTSDGTGCPNFQARYGPYGQMPLYGYGTNQMSNLVFKPW